jgi:lactoylglutathione lyase
MYHKAMLVEHIALWTEDIERLRLFYEGYFGAKANAKYRNERTQFQSYFMTFSCGARLELMQRPDVGGTKEPGEENLGYAHLAFSVGGEQVVDELTARLEANGYACLSGPRRTGDGYYESVVLDPDGNRIEITT